MPPSPPWWHSVPVPNGCTLRRKQVFEYTTPEQMYRVELFENPDGTCYAIGVPEDSERLIVYGSNVVDSPELALRILVDKIRRESGIFHTSPHSEEDDSSEDSESGEMGS
ncbi:MAG: hypothetical protein K6T81_00060 [Alicyclobacillus macrosporangiidus]|uniref:hypothetical protein n=1 Tax=Alicyclobacillus macrosporangiidus TaxID=392015 RepID=UPI0026EDB342|nr:hypothetical protein [Alicyclobacillus macrosporangiidus]MCL6597116.1 hypothetical protein [Alicyclobacillus macrosporangiidus]